MTPRNTPFQDLVISCLTALLKLKPSGTNKNLLQRFKDQSIKPLVRHYPEITGSGETTNRKVELFKQNFKWSQRAVYELVNYNPLKDDDTIHNYIKMEHICPVSRIVDRLVDLPPNCTRLDIQTILDHNETINNMVLGYEILIVSYQEMDVINRSNKEEYPLIDINTKIENKVPGKGLGSKGTIAQRLEAADIQLHKNYIHNSIKLY